MCDATDPPLPCLHIGDSRRAEAGGPWRQGFPDLLVVGQYRAIARELKGDGGDLHARQNPWLTWLVQAGIDADLWTPRQLHDGTVGHQLAEFNQLWPGQPPDTPDEARLRALYLPPIPAP